MRKYSVYRESQLSKTLQSLPSLQDEPSKINYGYNDFNFNPVVLISDPIKLESLTAIPPEIAAVRVRNVTIPFGRGAKVTNILDGINMSVPVGIIYGLLGPSGCGKTTLLRSVIGCLKPEKGSIRIFGFRTGEPGSGVPGPGVGYMPQDLALHDDLTIEEILFYFGRLYFMDPLLLRKRIDYMVSIMELPDKHQLVRTLSGGQKRRTSFAIALIHTPRLVILDEPTVGVDPVLRERIWDILVNFAEQERMTVIITTHYIEETKRSHIVGFMRRGKVLAQEPPHSLIKRFGVVSLEDVFYKLCVNQKRQSKLHKRMSRKGHYVEQIANTIISEIDYDVLLPTGEIYNGFKKEGLAEWFHKYSTVTKKIMLQTLRQPVSLVTQFIIPIVSLILFCICVGQTPKDVPLGIVNEESPPYLSSVFLKHISSEIVDQRAFSTINEAFKAVRRTEIYGFLHFQSNFSENLIQRAQLNDESDNKTIEDGTIRIYADLTNQILHVTIFRTLHEALNFFIKESLLELDYNPKIFDFPVAIGKPVYGESKVGDYFAVRDYGIPGVLIILTYSIAFGLTIIVLIVEKKDKMYDRNHVAGLSTTQLILGHLTARMTFMSCNVVIMFLIASTVFDVSHRGPLFWAILLLLFQSAAGLTHGMMVSAMCNELFMCTILTNGILLFTFIISGVLWPIESLPHSLRWLSYIQPTTLPTESLRSILARGLTVSHPLVYKGFVVSTFYIFFFFFASTILLRYKKN